jgi:hypothetical protein
MAQKTTWFDRLNAAIVRRIHGNVTLTADEHGVPLNGQRLAYADLQHAVAYHQSRYTYDELAVVLDFGEGRTAVFSESDEAWNAVLAALDAHPRNRGPSLEWRLALVAGGQDERIELL